MLKTRRRVPIWVILLAMLGAAFLVLFGPKIIRGGRYNAMCPACGHKSRIPEHASMAAQVNHKHRCPECLTVWTELDLRLSYPDKNSRPPKQPKVNWQPITTPPKH